MKKRIMKFRNRCQHHHHHRQRIRRRWLMGWTQFEEKREREKNITKFQAKGRWKGMMIKVLSSCVEMICILLLLFLSCHNVIDIDEHDTTSRVHNMERQRKRRVCDSILRVDRDVSFPYMIRFVSFAVMIIKYSCCCVSFCCWWCWSNRRVVRVHDISKSRIRKGSRKQTSRKRGVRHDFSDR